MWVEEVEILIANGGLRTIWGDNSKTEVWEERQIQLVGGESLQTAEME